MVFSLSLLALLLTKFLIWIFINLLFAINDFIRIFHSIHDESEKKTDFPFPKVKASLWYHFNINIPMNHIIIAIMAIMVHNTLWYDVNLERDFFLSHRFFSLVIRAMRVCNLYNVCRSDILVNFNWTSMLINWRHLTTYMYIYYIITYIMKCRFT